MDESVLKMIAGQLRKPQGQDGLFTAGKMNESNAKLYEAAIEELHVQDGEHILELGMANGRFAATLLQQAEGVQYTGCDFSATMVQEATRLNEEAVKAGRMQFCECEVSQMPFAGNSFDAVFNLNVIYFWEQPEKELAEIRRVLRPGGRLLTGIRPRHVMQNLPFTIWGFTLYDKDSLKELLEANGFRVTSLEEREEPSFEIEDKAVGLESIIAVAEVVK